VQLYLGKPMIMHWVYSKDISIFSTDVYQGSTYYSSESF